MLLSINKANVINLNDSVEFSFEALKLKFSFEALKLKKSVELTGLVDAGIMSVVLLSIKIIRNFNHHLKRSKIKLNIRILDHLYIRNTDQ